jgi:hypothetical protein
MDSFTLTTGTALVLVISLAIYQLGKPKPLPHIPHNKLHWFTGDFPFIEQVIKEKPGFSYAFDDIATRLGPVSQVCEHSVVPVIGSYIPSRWFLDLEHRGLANSSAPGM